MNDTILDISEGQPIGKWVAHPCPYCNDGKRRPILNIKRTHEKILYHCFSTGCDAHGFRKISLKTLNPNVIKNMLEMEAKTDRVRRYPLPERFTYDMPSKFWMYLKAYDISQDMQYRYKMGYVDVHTYNGNTVFMDRLVIPTPSGYLARSMEAMPKWMNFTDYDFTSYDFHRGDSVALVEDPISCIRVGDLMPCIALFGTSIKENHIHMCTDFKKAYIFLDGDRAGMSGSLKIKQALSPYVQTQIVNIDGKDPKDLSNFELKDILK